VSSYWTSRSSISPAGLRDTLSPPGSIPGIATYRVSRMWSWLPPRCHGHPPYAALNGTRWQRPGTATRRSHCKSAPRLWFSAWLRRVQSLSRLRFDWPLGCAWASAAFCLLRKIEIPLAGLMMSGEEPPMSDQLIPAKRKTAAGEPLRATPTCWTASGGCWNPHAGPASAPSTRS